MYNFFVKANTVNFLSMATSTTNGMQSNCFELLHCFIIVILNYTFIHL